jgi:hypothetical protein
MQNDLNGMKVPEKLAGWVKDKRKDGGAPWPFGKRLVNLL